MYVYQNGQKIRINPNALKDKVESYNPSNPSHSTDPNGSPIGSTWGWIVIGILSGIGFIILIWIIVGLIRKKNKTEFKLN